MKEDLINFNLAPHDQSIIMVIGIGGGGSNAVNRMYEEGIRDVEFMIANTDAQALFSSPVPRKIQLGSALTDGKGAGSRADIGEQAAIESLPEITSVLKKQTRMAFVVAGMGGGTGTGAAPVVARACRDLKILTVGVVTLPFRFEGPKRLRMAIQGINRLKEEVDALLIIHNEKLREIYGNKPISVAFANADEVLLLAVKGIAEIITIHGYINVDFADVMSVMRNGGIAFMGSASSSGKDRARTVIDHTINSPLLNNNDIKGASRVLLNITSGQEEITVDEIGIITDIISEKVGGRVNTIWGTCTDESLTDAIRVTLVATGFKDDAIPEWISVNPPRPERFDLVPPVSKSPSLPVSPSPAPEVSKSPSLEVSPSPRLEVSPSPSPEVSPSPPLPVSPPPSETVEFIITDRSIEEPAETQAAESETFVQRPPEPAQVKHPDTDRKAEMLRMFDFRHSSDPGTIDEVERVPAFKRKGKTMPTTVSEEEETHSRYTVGHDARLRPNNPYLHDAVD